MGKTLVLASDGTDVSGDRKRGTAIARRRLRVTDKRRPARLDLRALAVLPGGRLASGSQDRTIRVWDLSRSRELMLLEVDAAVLRLVALSRDCLVAGDSLGRLHWLEIVA